MSSPEIVNVALFLAAVTGAIALSSSKASASGKTGITGRVVPLERKHFWALLGITMAYLAPELAFTVHLLDTAAKSPHTDAIHGLDIIGRSLASVAVSLFVLQYFLSRAQLRMRYGVMALTLSATMALTFFSLRLPPQAWEDASTASTRSVAVRCAAIQKGLSQGLLAFSDMSFGDSALHKAWLPMTGFMCLHSPSLEEQTLKALTDSSLAQIVASEGGDRFAHAKYQKEVEARIKERYDEDYVANIKKAMAKRDRVVNQALELYDARRAPMNEAIDLAHKLPRLSAGPARDSALDKLVRLLADTQMLPLPEARDIQDAKAAINRQLPQGLQVSDDAIDRHLAQALSWMAATSMNLRVSPDTSLPGRRQLDAVISALVRQVALKQIADGALLASLPAAWDWNDMSTLRIAAIRAAERTPEYQAGLDKLQRELGTTRLDLPLQQFEVLPRVQRELREKLCAKLDEHLGKIPQIARMLGKTVRPLPACQSALPQDLVIRTGLKADKEFEREYIRPIFMPYVNWMLENLKPEHSSLYADGGKLEKEGREAYRMLVLVPFALFCSLLGASSHLLKLLILSARMGRTGHGTAHRSLLQRFSWVLPLVGGLTLVIAMGSAGKPILRDAAFQKMSTAMLAEFDADGHQTVADQMRTHAQVHLVRAVIVGQAGIYRTVTGIRDVLRTPS